MDNDTLINWFKINTDDENHVEEEDFEIASNGRVNFREGVILENCDLTKIPFKFGSVDGDFSINDSLVSNLDFLPTYVSCELWANGIMDKSRAPLPAYEFRKVLLVRAININVSHYINGEITLYDILSRGRINGLMPSELIPEKIRQLKDMDASWVPG